jgi:hypothetical protein
VPRREKKMTVGQPRRRISSRETTSQGSTRHLHMFTFKSQLIAQTEGYY